MYQKGIKRVIRVVGKSTISNLQFKRAQREANTNYDVIEVATREEARKHIK